MATAVYTPTQTPPSVRQVSKARVQRLSDEQLLELCETLYEQCLVETDPDEFGWLRQRLDLVNAEATKRKLIRWQL